MIEYMDINKMSYFKKYLKKFQFLLEEVKTSDIETISKIFIDCKKKKNSVFIFGNGGSASIASHVSTDLNKVCNIKSRNFNEASHITCFSNDYGYDNWITQTLKIYLKKSDIVILISSSGNSKNIVNAGKYCIKKKIKFITLTGFNKKNNLYSLSSSKGLNIWVNSKNYNFVENLHQIILLLAVDKVNNSKF